MICIEGVFVNEGTHKALSRHTIQGAFEVSSEPIRILQLLGFQKDIVCLPCTINFFPFVLSNGFINGCVSWPLIVAEAIKSDAIEVLSLNVVR